jgi:rhamnogalacturonyl hydrolase YesR
MTASESVRYRPARAAGFLEEATQDRDLGRWRACVDNSQLDSGEEALATATRALALARAITARLLAGS